ncbi:MAG: spermidine synthase [Desulfovibrionaceae bacterium]
MPRFVLACITLVVAFCSIVYELLMAQTLASLMGNTVLRYSVTIGVYLASLGAGAMLCGHEGRGAARRLLRVELGLSLVGGLSVAGLHALAAIQRWLAHDFGAAHPVLLPLAFFGLSHVVIVAVGVLSGYEIPLLIALRREMGGPGQQRAVNTILGVDYFGSLLGAVLFPLVLLPGLGVFALAPLTALCNAVACAALLGLRPWGRRTAAPAGWKLTVAALMVGCLGLAVVSPRLEQFFLQRLYFASELTSFSRLVGRLPGASEVVVRRSPYQRIHLVRRPANPLTEAVLRCYSDKLAARPDFPRGLWLYMDHQYQLNADFEEFYHEFFAHVPVQLAAPPRRVLLLGAGDGLLLRELLKYPGLERAVLVDLDPVILDMAARDPEFTAMNGRALADPRVAVEAADAFAWLRACPERFDAIYCDFPRPTNYDLSRLFSVEFHALVRAHLAPGGYAAADLPDDALWPVYAATFRAAGYGCVRPFEVRLEAENPALDREREDYVTMGGLAVPPDGGAADRRMFDQVVAPGVRELVRQRFVFLADDPSAGQGIPAFRAHGVALHVLNAGRLALALSAAPSAAPSAVVSAAPSAPVRPNTIERPSIPVLGAAAALGLQRPN